jgi:dTDP-4-dehydrorhamnose 3,5-epimerase
MVHETQLQKDVPSVTPDGERLAPLIHGVRLHRLTPIDDKRGELVEMYRPSWGLHPDPMVYAYQVSLRPGATRGWTLHKLTDDRLFMSLGVLRWALYDDRPESATREMLNVFTLSERNRKLLVIPRGVFHAVRNLGTSDAFFVNMPNRAYDHADPDKHRLPLKNSLIPFDFDAETW